ncbi:ammonium transporter [Lacisediminihabitans profunda]|uniref:Ammonium transporter n=1 Tax=Lacisediminihabitans profunda TaxID=2594790 RepID=A0A5C8UVS2_9MICO|nr:ammonium transporter [Lacisediminihabitans profunda]TXN32122.1 ammonium transporter [Lacisediminihabitans profunda]
MTATSVWLSVLGAAAVLASASFFTLVQNRLAGRSSRGAWSALAAIAAVGAAMGLVLVALRPPGFAPLFIAPIAALCAFFAVVVTSPVRAPGRRLPVLVFGALATAFVALPALATVFGTWFDPFGTGLGFIDIGAALPALVAAGSGGGAVLWIERRSQVWVVAPVESWGRVLWPTLAMWAAWLGWLVALELAIDSHTSLIVLNAVLMPLAGALAGALVERVRDRANTPLGVVTGLIGGLAAATPACANLEPAIGVLVGALSGAVCLLLPRRGSASLLPTVSVGAGIGLVLIGGLATDVSFIYTGQPEVLMGQALAVIAAAVWSFAVCAILWATLRRIGRSRPTEPLRGRAGDRQA